MKFFRKTVKFILLPIFHIKPGIIKFAVTLNSIYRVLAFSNLSPTISKHRNHHELNCYVFGNGPSLRTTLTNNLEFFKDKCIFVVNDFVMYDLYTSLKPKYYVFADPGYWVNNSPVEMMNKRNLIFNAINEKTSWDLIILTPYSCYQTRLFQTLFRNNNKIQVIAFNDTKIEGLNSVNHIFFKRNLGMPCPQNVLIPALYLAINIGFKNISLLGAEHSWTKNLTVDDDNIVCLLDSHFYDNEDKKIMPLYNVAGEIYKMHEILVDYAKMFESYHVLRKYAEYRHVSIYNYTPGSFIDAFERKRIEND